MKMTLRNFIVLVFLFFGLMQACTKDATQTSTNLPASLNGNEVENSKQVKQLVLQPGPTDGVDTWLTWKQNDDIITNSNWDTVSITAAYAWTSGGIPINGRSLIKFKGLSAIPSNSTIISARLYMYGVENSIHLPAGNSIYKGSPYHEDNSMTVLRVIQNWNASTATWNNQPKIAKADAVVIPISTSQWNYDANVDVTPMVAKMVANPSTNYGFMFRMAIEEIYKCMQFSSSNYYIPERRPKLVVVYK